MHKTIKALHGHKKEVEKRFYDTHRHAKRLFKTHGIKVKHLRKHAVKTVGVAGLASSALIGPVYAASAVPQPQVSTPGASISTQTSTYLGLTQATATNGENYGPSGEMANMAGLFSEKVERIADNPAAGLTSEQETAIAQLIQEQYGINATAELDGIRLNTTYGVMAGEQHLPLYPGDTLANHGSDPTKEMTGMVPGLPSWGYFAPSKAEVTQKDIERERYYIAAQTFLAPGWKQNVEKYYKWFKYRKMIMVNPTTGSAVVVVIGDAGPSPRLNRAWGGSNEVMMGLDLGKTRKGGIYGFFVNDPEDKIPLGPVNQATKASLGL